MLGVVGPRHDHGLVSEVLRHVLAGAEQRADIHRRGKIRNRVGHRLTVRPLRPFVLPVAEQGAGEHREEREQVDTEPAGSQKEWDTHASRLCALLRGRSAPPRHGGS